MNTAIIGYSGFVGSNLVRQRHFGEMYNSENIGAIAGKRFKELVISAAPAEKWRANKDPDMDRRNLANLTRNLGSCRADTVILVSTIDVYQPPYPVDEDTPIDRDRLHPYGLHRLELEDFVAKHFPSTFVVRLPGLFGTGLKKNIIFDFLHNNRIDQIDSRNQFQFYSLENLSYDIDRVLSAQTRLINIATEPLETTSVAEICGFPEFRNDVLETPNAYDVRSVHANRFGGADGYLYSRSQVLSELSSYVARERAS